MVPSPRKSPRSTRTRSGASNSNRLPGKQTQTSLRTKAKQKGGKRKRVDDATSTKCSKELKTREVLVPWSNKQYHHYTDALLTLIEDSEQYKLAFGFEKGSSTPVTSGGKKPIDICRTLAEKVLLADKETKWSNKTHMELGEAVKNRVYNLKTLYNKNRALLKETGQGLLDEGREDEITEGTTLWNVWDKIKRDFPWYLRMHTLMGTSPVADRSGVAVSGTRKDLGVLGVQQSSGIAHDSCGVNELEEDVFNDRGSEIWDIEGDSPMKDTSSSTLQPPPANFDDSEVDVDSHRGSPGLDDDGVASPTPSPIKKQPIAVPVAYSMKAAPAKRSKGGIFGELETQVTAQRYANLEINKSNNKARIEVEKVRQNGKLKVQKMRFEAAKEEREAKLSHELELMQMRLEFQQKAGQLPQFPTFDGHASSSLAFPSVMSIGMSANDPALDFSYSGDSTGTSTPGTLSLNSLDNHAY